MGGVERPAVNIAAVRYAVAELLSRPDLVAGCAEAADVVVDIRTVAGQRDDVVGHRRWSEDAVRKAISAERLGVKAALPLRYTTTTTKAVGLRLSVAEACDTRLTHKTSRFVGLAILNGLGSIARPSQLDG